MQKFDLNPYYVFDLPLAEMKLTIQCLLTKYHKGWIDEVLQH